MNLSVIVPTRNRAPLLQRTLESLLVQTCPFDLFEVIVVDNGSNDQTRSVCDLFSDRFPNFRYYYDDRPGLHVGRHVGLKQGRGEVLVYCDDDIRAFPTWLSGVAESFQDPRVALVGGKALPEFDVDPPDWLDTLWEKTSSGRALPLLSLLDLGEEKREISPFYVFGCNYSIRKDVLLEIKGFHPDGMPEKLILLRGDGETAVSQSVQEMGYKTIYNPNASVYHFVNKERMTADYLYHRSFLQGISDSYTITRRKGGPEAKDRSHLSYSIKKMKIHMKCLFEDNRKIKQSIQIGYLHGFRFHQENIRKDPGLLAWIVKDHYMDDMG